MTSLTGSAGTRSIAVTGLEIYLKSTLCAHSCRYCLIGRKSIQHLAFPRFAALVGRFLDWRQAVGRTDLKLFLGIDHSFEFEVATLKELFDLQQQAGWSDSVRGIRLGGLKWRSESEMHDWLQARRDVAGIRSVHASLAGYGAVHDKWNGRKGDFEFLYNTMVAAADLGLRIAQRLFVVQSTLPHLDRLVERLDAIPGTAQRYLCSFFYRGLASRLESEQITEQMRDALPASVASLERRDAAHWKSEREWLADPLVGDRVDPVWLRLELTDENIESLEAASCEQIVEQMWRRTLAAYGQVPSWSELRERWGDHSNTSIYTSREDVERLWLDRHLRETPTTFERRLTYLANEH